MPATVDIGAEINGLPVKERPKTDLGSGSAATSKDP